MWWLVLLLPGSASGLCFVSVLLNDSRRLEWWLTSPDGSGASWGACWLVMVTAVVHQGWVWAPGP